jgi:hypothetical protein
MSQQEELIKESEIQVVRDAAVYEDAPEQADLVAV